MNIHSPNPTVSFRHHLGGKGGEIVLASYDQNKHLNVIVQAGGSRDCICAHPDDVMALRDELLKLYPLAKANTYDPKNPKKGDVVVLKEADDVAYFKLHHPMLVAPFTVTFAPSVLSAFACITVQDGAGRQAECFPERFKAYGSPVVEKSITKADLLAAEERGRASSFAAGKQAGREEAKAEAKAKQPKWEVVTDGLDRCKVEGGYIYQTDNEHIAFVPSNPSAKSGDTGVCTYKAPCSARREF